MTWLPYTARCGGDGHRLGRLRGEAGKRESKSAVPPEKGEGRPITAPSPLTSHGFAESRRRNSGSEDFVANVFEHIGRSLDTHFTGENGILVLNAEDAIVTDVHVSLHDGLPD